MLIKIVVYTTNIVMVRFGWGLILRCPILFGRLLMVRFGWGLILRCPILFGRLLPQEIIPHPHNCNESKDGNDKDNCPSNSVCSFVFKSYPYIAPISLLQKTLNFTG